jgi:glycosyltransferase involved in cell wall biosynthesis
VNTPLVSILIPAFNASRWIRATVESALAQTWPNTEIIVVDDGSDDDTAGIVRGMGAMSVRVIRQAHAGSSAAHNHAFRACTGDFIQRIDADDLISPDKISMQMARLIEHPGAVAVGEWARFVTDPNRARFPAPMGPDDLSPIDWLCRECDGGLPMMAAARWLAPRSVANAAGDWDEQLTLNNDFDYGVRLVLAADRVVVCPGARLYYRSGNPGSLASTRSSEAWRSSLRAIELGTTAFLARQSDPRTRRVCADVFQQLAYTAYLDAPAVFVNASESVRWLGGSAVQMQGGLLFGLLRTALGWRHATRIKSFAYRGGYERIARAKQAALGRGLER